MPVLLDVIELANNIRKADVDELNAITDMDVMDAILVSIEMSDPDFLFSARSGEKLLAIGGCNIYGQPWMVSTKHIFNYKKSLSKYAKCWVRMMLGKYRKLQNTVDSRNTKSIAWLKSIGFEFTGTVEHKPGFPFLIFEMSCHATENTT